MMLWKKESTRSDALYVNLMSIASSEQLERGFYILQLQAKLLTAKKNDDMSLLKRKEGNVVFLQKDWIKAIEKYNECLRFAPQHSLNISLAYGNRSACFHHLRMYENCLKDIELAKKYQYPTNLMPKLDNRQIDCLKRITNGEERQKWKPKLDFETDEKFPYMANVVDIAHDIDDQSAVAKQDIDIGKTIVVDEPFFAHAIQKLGTKCTICLKINESLQPCTHCTDAMFCSDECRDSPLHGCGMKICEDNLRNSFIVMHLKGVLMGISIFPNVYTLIRFVEEVIYNDSKPLPKHLSDAKSKFHAFLKFPIDPFFSEFEKISDIYVVYKLILSIPKFNIMFNTERRRRFLMHLIAHHFRASSAGHIDENIQNCLMSRYFKHSCAPNLLKVPYNGHEVYITIRPVKKGEPLCVAYAYSILLKSKQERQINLWMNRKMKCVCLRCEGITISPDQRNQMRSDSNYQYILNLQSYSAWGPNDITKIPTIKDKCKTFLTKYNHVLWSEEIGKVLEAYINVLSTPFFLDEFEITKYYDRLNNARKEINSNMMS